MTRLDPLTLFPLRAPLITGALLLSAFALLSCEEPDTTPEWESSARTNNEVPVAAEELKSARAAVPTNSAGSPAPAELRFVSYNLRNYLTTSRQKDGREVTRSKPEREIAAIIELLGPSRPDVLGLCEIGTATNLYDLQERLAAAGVDLPHSEYTGGADKDRHLALLSRFPISARNSQRALSYTLLGKRAEMRRGILDATIAMGDRSIRLVGVHLKSKREIPQGDQALMRRNEAYLLRKHADRILAADPGAFLCVYGDLNDTRRSTTLTSIKGPARTNRFLQPLSLTDSRGEFWTHFWEDQHIYSCFDYVLVNDALEPFVDRQACRILDDPAWSTASDHRPLLTVFRWEN